MSPFVELTFDGPLARLTLKRADKLNALDRAMIDALAEAARTIEASRDARVAILSGEGKAFCAGGDIAAWGGLPRVGDVARLDARRSPRFRSAGAAARAPDRGADRSRLRRRPGTRGGRRHPHCRARRSNLGLPETGLGMAPGWSGTQRLVRRFRRHRSFGAWRWPAQCLPPKRGWRSAWSTRSTAKGEGLARAEAMAADIAKRGPSPCRCQGDDQFRRRRGPRRADRRTRRRADRDD